MFKLIIDFLQKLLGVSGACAFVGTIQAGCDVTQAFCFPEITLNGCDPSPYPIKFGSNILSMKNCLSVRLPGVFLLPAILFGIFLLPGKPGLSQGIATRPLTLSELADRIAIKELVDAYAHDADRRDSVGQANLFAPDGSIEIYEHEPSKTARPLAILKGRDQLQKGFAGLKKYDATMHLNGQTDLQVNGDSATGETYCLAHQFWNDHGQPIMLVLGIRYYDNFIRINGSWFFTKRKLIFDWTDRRINKTKNPQD